MAPMPSRKVVVRGRAGRLVYNSARRGLRGVARVYLRVEVVGQERVPKSGAFIVAPVHRSAIDSPLTGLVLERPTRFMAKSSAFVNGPISAFLTWAGAFPVDRDGTDFAAIHTLESLIEGGEPVVVFPEGTRKAGDRVTDLRDGPAFIAARQRIPIVPVGIGGTDKAMPKGSKFLLPRKVVFVIGEPIYPDVELEGRVPRRVISELTEQVRVELERLYAEASDRAD
ncbi:MAG: 1-acyl-sn-glycerol-3-phosphate acyltransferase [Actinobacteria bacterium]|nr:1-acyl-sn-glycerol-3-phosphate acyltransferase [Actinomycetota bacterium]